MILGGGGQSSSRTSTNESEESAVVVPRLSSELGFSASASSELEELVEDLEDKEESCPLGTSGLEALLRVASGVSGSHWESRGLESVVKKSGVSSFRRRGGSRGGISSYSGGTEA